MNTSLAPTSDAQLVADSLHGNRDAFGTLVTRHQQAVCAVAYARTGSLAVSEDIAQETFLTAWKNLGRLREPERFRGWLCGVARRLAFRFHRDKQDSVPLADDLADTHVPPPSETAISREEEALLWAALETLPENHREPLILFYRAGSSVRDIATALHISEDAARQRLSRGRAMLQEAVRKKVESTLERSRPGSAFAVTVLAALPSLATSAQAAGTGIALAKGTATAAATGVLSMMGGLFIGLGAAWFGMKGSLERAESERERKFIKSVGLWSGGTILVSMAILMALVFWARPMQKSQPELWTFLMAANILSFSAVMVICSIRNNRELLGIRNEERMKRGAAATGMETSVFEYRSRWHFLGLPLIHCSFGGSGPGVAKGWIACGNIAIAPLLAFGGVAIGGIAIGGVSLGLVTTAAIGIGLFSFAGIAIGGIVVGGLAVGWIAIGGAAWGSLAALGGQARAGLYGMGYNVAAPHANDATAKAFFHDSGISQAAQFLADYGVWMQLAIGLPIFFALYRLRKVAALRR